MENGKKFPNEEKMLTVEYINFTSIYTLNYEQENQNNVPAIRADWFIKLEV